MLQLQMEIELNCSEKVRPDSPATEFSNALISGKTEPSKTGRSDCSFNFFIYVIYVIISKDICFAYKEKEIQHR